MDPLSITTGVITLLATAIQSSKSLYNTIQSFRTHERRVRGLRNELEALIQVLEALKDIAHTEDPIMSLLELPVSCCQQSCDEFESVIIKCSAHSGKPRTSFRDWTKIRYMGGDIDEFKDVLAGYKSTISIAIGSLNMQSCRLTRQAFDEYSDMIKDATDDLESYLHLIDEKLSNLANQNGVDPKVEQHKKRMEEERRSTQQCLQVCDNVKTYIEGLEASLLPAHGEFDPDESRVLTNTALNECRNRMLVTISGLQKRLGAVNKQSLAKSENFSSNGQSDQDESNLTQQIITATQCLEICNIASEQASRQRVHFFEDVTVEDNSEQVIVSTVGDLLNAKRISAGTGSSQWMGSMSDASLQQMSQRSPVIRPTGTSETSPPFTGRYGHGHKLEEQPASLAVKRGEFNNIKRR